MPLRWSNNSDEEQQRALLKLEQLLDSKTQRLSFLEESIQDVKGMLNELLEQKDESDVRRLLIQERDEARDEVVRLCEYNRKLMLRLKAHDGNATEESALTAPLPEGGDTQPAQQMHTAPQSSADCEALRAELNAASATIAELQEQLKQAEDKNAAINQELQATEKLRKRIFPAYFDIPAMQSHLLAWKKQLEAQSPDFCQLSMIAAIFSASSALECLMAGQGTQDTRIEAVAGLYSFSRYFFDYLYADGCTPEQADDIARALADNINETLVQAKLNYELFLSYLEEEYDQKIMIPDSSGSQIGLVHQLCSWGIKDRENGIIHKKCQVQLKKT